MGDLVEKAQELVNEFYRQGSLMKNKEEYCRLLREFGLEEDSICAALLYEVEHEDINLEFGKNVLELANELREFDRLVIKAAKRNKAEKTRKMLISTTQNMRVLLIKLLERLHEMRNLELLNPIERKRISRDTMDIYAPIAYRLGMSDVKWELEDLSFKYLEPNEFKKIKTKIGMRREEREKIIDELKKKLEKELGNKKIKYEVYGRPKHFYSIYKKMINKNKKFEDIHDILGLRVIVENSDDCYAVLSIVDNLWETLPDRFKDYIVAPRNKVYQSLHAGFLHENIPIEVQIRTRKMNDLAEEGIAAHWKYKGLSGDKKFNKQLGWLRQILDFGNESDKEFLYKLKLDLFGDKIFCFTPKGDIIELDEGSTVIDFAYGVHSEIGEKCVAGKVNGKFVSPRQALRNGDEVEVLTSNIHKPSREWLGFVKTSKAMEKIKQYLRVTGLPGRKKSEVEERSGENFIGVEGDYELNLAKCCSPLPGEDIIGAVSSFKRVIVHSLNCENVSRIKKKIEVFWIEEFKAVVNIEILAEDRVGLFAEILNAVAALGINVQTASVHSVSDEIAGCNLHVDLTTLKDLREVIKRIKNIKGVKKLRVE